VKLSKEDWLAIAFIPPLIVDALLTLAGQPVAYWLYEPRAIYEASPLASFFLAAGPLVFLLFSLGWLIIAVMVVKKMPYPFNLFLSLFFVLAHIGAADRWLRIILLYGIELKVDSIWWAYRGLDLVFAGFAAYCYHNWARGEGFKAGKRKLKRRR
jgi:hypothetical protein